MLGWVEKFLGGWLSKQLDRLVSWVVKKFKSYFAGAKHKTEVDKYVDLINSLTEKAKAEVLEFGKVTPETEKELALALERRNRNIPFDDNYKLQDDTGN